MPTLSQRVAKVLLRSYPFRRGQGRIIDRTVLRRTRFREEQLTVRTKHGFMIDILPNDLIGRHLYYTGQFDRTIVDVLTAFAAPGDRIIDIGANIGYVTCCLLRSVAGSVVVAVEPQKGIFQIMQRNIRRIASRRAIPVRAAVSDRCGVGRLRSRSGNTGGAHLVNTEDELDGTDSIEDVELVDGGELMSRAGIDRVDLVKIDVEGHELSVLRGLEAVIRNQQPKVVLFESTDVLDDSHGISHCFRLLGYRLFGIEKHLLYWKLRPLEVLRSEGRLSHDYVATPAQSKASNEAPCSCHR